jgi:hypothetical protein
MTQHTTHSTHAANDDPFSVPSGGDESGCVKPWLGAVKTPKNPPPINPGVPAVTMDLKWVHGYASGTACYFSFLLILILCFLVGMSGAFHILVKYFT